VNKADLIAAPAEGTDLSRAKAGEVVDAVFGAITEALKKKEEVRLVGFGTFAASRKAGAGRAARKKDAGLIGFRGAEQVAIPEPGYQEAHSVANLAVANLESRRIERRTTLGKTMRPPGFRPGKVPTTIPDNPATEASLPVDTGIAKTFLAVLARWNIPERLASTILGSDREGFIAELAAGDAVLGSRDMRDRARLFLDIYEGVFGLLGDKQPEREWIRAPREDFAGQSLLDLLAEGSQRNLIRALAFIDYINGR
jgi:DNA-binding protein HU-beta